MTFWSRPHAFSMMAFIPNGTLTIQASRQIGKCVDGNTYIKTKKEMGNVKKVFSIALALVLVLAMLPISVLAAVDFTLGTTDCNYYNLISKTDYNLAPGAVESEIVINDDTGNKRKGFLNRWC